MFAIKKLHEFADGCPKWNIIRLQIDHTGLSNDRFDFAFIDKNATLSRSYNQFRGIFNVIAIIRPLTEHDVGARMSPFNDRTELSFYAVKKCHFQSPGLGYVQR